MLPAAMVAEINGRIDYCRCEPNLEEQLDDKWDSCFAAAKGGKPNNWSMDVVAVVIVGVGPDQMTLFSWYVP